MKLAEDMLPSYRFETLLGFKVLKGVALESGEACLLEAQIEPAGRRLLPATGMR